MRPFAREWRIHRLRFPIRPAPDDREIFFHETLLLHEKTEMPGGPRRFGHEHHSARFAIQAIDDRDLPAVRELEGEQTFQLAPERPHAVWFRRVNKEKRRLVHDEILIGFGDDREVRGRVCAIPATGG